jgi:hypothetical protein
MPIGMDYHGVRDILGTESEEVGSIDGIYRSDSVGELPRYQVGRSWRFVTVTGLRTVMHL